MSNETDDVEYQEALRTAGMGYLDLVAGMQEDFFLSEDVAKACAARAARWICDNDPSKLDEQRRCEKVAEAVRNDGPNVGLTLTGHLSACERILEGIRNPEKEVPVLHPKKSDAALAEIGPADGEIVVLHCLYCNKPHRFAWDSSEASGVFNVFCPNGECEDRCAATQ